MAGNSRFAEIFAAFPPDINVAWSSILIDRGFHFRHGSFKCRRCPVRFERHHPLIEEENIEDIDDEHARQSPNCYNLQVLLQKCQCTCSVRPNEVRGRDLAVDAAGPAIGNQQNLHDIIEDQEDGYLSQAFRRFGPSYLFSYRNPKIILRHEKVQVVDDDDDDRIIEDDIEFGDNNQIKEIRCRPVMQLRRDEPRQQHSFGVVCGNRQQHGQYCSACNELMQTNDFETYYPTGRTVNSIMITDHERQSIAYLRGHFPNVPVVEHVMVNQQGFNADEVQVTLLRVSKNVWQTGAPDMAIDEALKLHRNQSLRIRELKNDPGIPVDTKVKVLQELRSAQYCKMCKERLSKVAYLPCGHLVLCPPCFQVQQANPPILCPYCNELMEREIIIHDISGE